jgi:hypothetical protein
LAGSLHQIFDIIHRLRVAASTQIILPPKFHAAIHGYRAGLSTGIWVSCFEYQFSGRFSQQTD